jgi:ketosteroid isomerase-like protein
MTSLDQSAAFVGSRTWYEEFYARIDAGDITVVDDLMTPDTRMTMGNNPTTEGADVFRENMRHLFTHVFARMKHTFHRVVEDGDYAVLEATCEYFLHDGRHIALPVMTAIERRDGRVAAQRVYIDMAPLHAAH